MDKLVNEKVVEVLEKLEDDINTYLEWHEYLLNDCGRDDKENQEARVQSYKIAKKKVKHYLNLVEKEKSKKNG